MGLPSYARASTWTVLPFTEETPFDAVYLSALEPDNIATVDRAALGRLSGIEDRSDQIRFDDGLDD